MSPNSDPDRRANISGFVEVNPTEAARWFMAAYQSETTAHDKPQVEEHSIQIAQQIAESGIVDRAFSN